MQMLENDLREPQRGTQSSPVAQTPSTFHPSATNRADVDIFINDAGVLEAHVTTERLYLRSVGAHGDELKDYQKLFGLPQAMQRYAVGTVYTGEEITERYSSYLERWRSHDPFSSLTARLHDNDDFVGQVTLGRSDRPGQAELAAASLPRFWRSGLATEGARAVVCNYVPDLISAGYRLDGHQLTTISATARPDNPGAFRTLERFGFKLFGVEEKHGAVRNHYQLQLSTLTSLSLGAAETPKPPLCSGLEAKHLAPTTANAVPAQHLGPLTIQAGSTTQLTFRGRFGDGVLIPLQEGYSNWIYENLFSDKDVLRWYRNGKGRTRQETQRFVRERAKAWQENLIGGWLVCVNQLPAGYFGCERFDGNQLEIGYAFAPKFWGQGLASASVSRVLQYLKTVETPFRAVIATAHPDNVASQSVLQKAGFVFTKESLRDDYDDSPRRYFAWTRPPKY